MNVLVLFLLLLASSVQSFSLSNVKLDMSEAAGSYYVSTQIQRRDTLKIGPLIIGAFLGINADAANATEQKVYSSNAKNIARLSNGDSSGGSLYNNNPSTTKARRRRAMVGCKNPSARQLAGKMIGNSTLSEKDCNQIVMEGDGTFMLEVLTELDCPTCPFGIAKR